MESVHKGSCLCGLVKYELTGAFQQFFLCHCTRCQKDTGTAHAANLLGSFIGTKARFKAGNNKIILVIKILLTLLAVRMLVAVLV